MYFLYGFGAKSKSEGINNNRLNHLSQDLVMSNIEGLRTHILGFLTPEEIFSLMGVSKAFSEPLRRDLDIILKKELRKDGKLFQVLENASLKLRNFWWTALRTQRNLENWSIRIQDVPLNEPMITLPSEAIPVEDFLILKKFIGLNNHWLDCEARRNKFFDKINIVFLCICFGIIALNFAMMPHYFTFSLEEKKALTIKMLWILTIFWIGVLLCTPVFKDTNASSFQASLLNIIFITTCDLIGLDMIKANELSLRKKALINYTDKHVLEGPKKYLGYGEGIPKNGESVKTIFSVEYASNFYLLSFKRKTLEEQFPITSGFKTTDAIKNAFLIGPKRPFEQKKISKP